MKFNRLLYSVVVRISIVLNLKVYREMCLVTRFHYIAYRICNIKNRFWINRRTNKVLLYFFQKICEILIYARNRGYRVTKKWSTSKLYHSPVDINVGRNLRVETGAVHRRRRCHHRCLTCCIMLKTMEESRTITRCIWCRNARGDLSTSLERVQTILWWNICLAERSNLYSASRISTSVINFSIIRREKTFLVKGKKKRCCSAQLRFSQKNFAAYDQALFAWIAKFTYAVWESTVNSFALSRGYTKRLA